MEEEKKEEVLEEEVREPGVAGGSRVVGKQAALGEVIPAPSQQYITKAEQDSLAFMNPRRWAVMNEMAKVFMISKALPSTIVNAPQLVMVLQAGYEAGLQPIQAINSFYFVNGKLSMYGDTVVAQVIRAGHKVEWGECDESKASVTITRGDNGSSHSATFTMAAASARRMDWDFKNNKKKDVWVRYPENMLKYRVFGQVAHFIVPDALQGIPIGESKEVIEAVIEGGIEVDEGNGMGKPVSLAQKSTPATPHTLSAALKEVEEEEVGTDSKTAPSAPQKATQKARKRKVTKE
jgi:hypothetical protein